MINGRNTLNRSNVEYSIGKLTDEKNNMERIRVIADAINSKIRVT